ncbi:MAG: hypothetical protein IKW13_03300, partial [Thermoguttaceae bacterium]|nr:hypothetical protein [Thermoguttaceae bacterium]
KSAFFGCPSDLTLYGSVGSVAQKYAEENGLHFAQTIDALARNFVDQEIEALARRLKEYAEENGLHFTVNDAEKDATE